MPVEASGRARLAVSAGVSHPARPQKRMNRHHSAEKSEAAAQSATGARAMFWSRGTAVARLADDKRVFVVSSGTDFRKAGFLCALPDSAALLAWRRASRTTSPPVAARRHAPCRPPGSLAVGPGPALGRDPDGSPPAWQLGQSPCLIRRRPAYGDGHRPQQRRCPCSTPAGCKPAPWEGT